jgi:hypothetical protein
LRHYLINYTLFMYKSIKLWFRYNLLRKKLCNQRNIIDYSIIEEGKKYVLVVDDKMPEYNKDSGSRRLTEIMRLIVTNGYGVYLLADVKEYRFSKEYVSYFQNLGAIVYQPAISPKGDLITREKFIEIVAPQLSYAWLHRPNIFEKYYPVLKKHAPSVPVAFDMVDFHYLRIKREAELNYTPSKIEEAEKHLKQELSNCSKADKIIVISENDKAALLEFYPDKRKMEVIGNIHDHISPGNNFYNFKDRSGLLFIGGFAHKPNEDAVLFLHNDIMPLVWKQLPDVIVNIVGSNPSEAVKALNKPQFKIVGYVDDAGPYFVQSRLFVAPLRYGAGIKGKIGQSMEYSLPLVTTPIGAEGFDFSEVENIVIAETAQDFAQKIISLYTDEEKWNAVSAGAVKVIAPFSLKAVEASVLKLLRG